MSKEKQLSSYKEIVWKLRHICDGGDTGTFSLATRENHYASISMKDGQIIGVTYRQSKGPAALENIRKVSAGRCTFAPGILRNSEVDASLPSSKAIFEYLGIGEIKPAITARINGPASNTEPSENQNGAARQAIELEATEYLGPMAAIICEEHFARVGNLHDEENMWRVLEGIAGDVGDKAKGKEFKKGVITRLSQ
jgi:hypothetical protein